LPSTQPHPVRLPRDIAPGPTPVVPAPAASPAVPGTPAPRGPERWQQIDALVRDLSKLDDPDQLVRAFASRGDILVRNDGFITVSRRGLAPPAYRVSRSWRMQEVINPWTEPHRLPVLGHGLLGELLYRGRPALINRLKVADDDPARDHLAGMSALVCAPSYERGEPVNMVMLLRREPDSLTPADLENLLLHANLLGRAVGNLVLARKLEEANQRLDAEMEQAGRLQRELLPERLPDIDGLELAASYVTCSQAGGDYYQALPLDGGRWGLFLADVSGHGVAAAVGTGMLHALLLSCPGPRDEPGVVLAHMNRPLARHAPGGLFATAFYGVYDPPQRTLRFALAGHPPPLLRLSPFHVAPAPALTGFPLGVVEDAAWPEQEHRFHPGQAFLLYTDGVTEGLNPADEMFGAARLADTVRLAPGRAARLVEHVDRHFRDFRAGAADLDDRTLLVGVAVP